MMAKMGKIRVWLSLGVVGIVACSVVGPAGAGLFGRSKGKQKEAAPVVQSLIVFPFDQGEVSSVPETTGEDIASALRSSIGGSDRYMAFLYRDRLAPIKRAREDNTLKLKEDMAPFAQDKEKALKLARLLAADYYLVGSIEDYNIDASKKIAQMTVSVDLMEAKTGKLLRTMLVTGRTPDSAMSTEEDEARALAAGDVIAKLSSQLAEENKPEEAAAPAVSETAAAK